MNRRTVAAAIAITALTSPIKAIALAPTAHAVPGCVHDRACHRHVVQGIHDGQSAITEDSPQWSCVDDGNRICGPNNPEGKPAACYDDGGVIVALWPCHVVIDPRTGDSDVYADPGSPQYPAMSGNYPYVY